MEKRLEFLRNERDQKLAEVERIEEKWRKLMGRQWIWSKSRATIVLNANQMKSRANDLRSQIRSLDFEINNLEAEIKKGEREPLKLSEENDRIRHFCSSCGRDISLLPTDVKYCPFCGSKL